MSTREFVRKLVDTLGIPVVFFGDGDPAGIQLALTFAHGAISTALETPWLACSEIRWAGMCPSDFDRHCGRNDEIRLAEYDQKKARELLEHPSRAYVNDRVRHELEVLLDHGFKVELDGIANDMARFTGYLKHKLEGGDLIEL